MTVAEIAAECAAGNITMNCFYCKGTLKDSSTTHVVRRANFVGDATCIIIIKDVPCTECVQCGQTFYDDDVAQQLEKIVKEMKTAIT